MTTQAELVRLEIPAMPAFVGVARTVVVAIATSVEGIDDDRLEDLRIAVSEACTNAVEAHPTEGTDQRVVLRCLLDDERLEIRIEDSSGGAAAAPGGDDGVAVRAEQGWGLQLIRALVDDVTFDQTADGATVALAMRLHEPDGNGSRSGS